MHCLHAGFRTQQFFQCGHGSVWCETELRGERRIFRCATPEQKEAFQKELNEKIQEILTLPEEKLFKVKKIKIPPPPKVGKYKAKPCGNCGEHTHEGRFKEVDGKKVCTSCYEIALERKKWT